MAQGQTPAPRVVVGEHRGTAVGYDRGQLRLILPRAFAPGQPLQLELHDAAVRLSLTGKSLGSRRREDGGFDVTLKLTNLRRELRQRLEGLFA